MLMYEIYNNDLFIDLQKCEPPITLPDSRINAVAYADDITLLASSQASLQSLFNVADRYSRKWQFAFNPEKCVLIYGRDKFNDGNVYLGYHKLKNIKKEPHLGVVLVTKPTYEEV